MTCKDKDLELCGHVTPDPDIHYTINARDINIPGNVNISELNINFDVSGSFGGRVNICNYNIVESTNNLLVKNDLTVNGTLYIKHPVVYTPTPQCGGTIDLYYTSNSPFIYTDINTDPLIRQLLNRSLTSISSSTGELLADLATDVGTPSDDNKTWTFTLKTNNKYSNGDIIVADDIKYGVYKYFMDGSYNFPNIDFQNYLDLPANYDSSMGESYFDEAVSCPDDVTIIFKLNQSVYDFNYMCSYITPIQRANDLYPKYTYGSTLPDSSIKLPISSGPYMIDTYTEELTFNSFNDPFLTCTLNRNPNFDNCDLSANYADHFNIYSVFVSPALRGFNTNTNFDLKILDGYNSLAVVPTTIDNYYNIPKNNKIPTVNNNSLMYITANILSMSDINLRKAIFYALDVASLNNVLNYKDQLNYANNIVDNISPFMKTKDASNYSSGIHDSPWSQNGYNDTAALNKAVYYMNQLKTSNSQLYHRVTDSSGSGLQFLIYNNNNLEAIIEQSLNSIGINVVFTNGTAGHIINICTSSATWDMAWYGQWITEPFSPYSYCFTPILGGSQGLYIDNNISNKGSSNYSYNYSSLCSNADKKRYNNYITAYNNASASTQDSSGVDLWDQVASLAMNSFWIIPLFKQISLTMTGSGIVGLTTNVGEGGINYNQLFLANKVT